MEIKYYVLDPTKNITILVETPVPQMYRRFVADKLMDENPSAEQVGFIVPAEDADIAVEMAGGEFCGNAVLCAAFLTGKENCKVKMSGNENIITVNNGCAVIPAPVSINDEQLFAAGEIYEKTVVNMGGIAHIIIETPMEKAYAEECVRRWCYQLQADALGLMLMNGNEMTPLVYVIKSETCYWEHSCASGSCAAAAYFAAESGGPVSLDLHEPGGVIHVETAPGEDILLSGKVELIAEKTVELQ